MKRNRKYFIGMACEYLQELASSDIPDSQLPIAPTRRCEPIVGRESCCKCQNLYPEQFGLQLIGLGRPNARGAMAGIQLIRQMRVAIHLG